MGEFTRGLWILNGYGPVVVELRSNFEIIEITAEALGGGAVIDDCMEANARLIAAAPDLYEACKAALEAVKFMGRLCNDGTNGPCGICTPCLVNKAVPQLKNALAKAESHAEPPSPDSLCICTHFAGDSDKCEKHEEVGK